MGVAADIEEHYLFWSDLGPNNKGIWRADLDGLQAKRIVETGLFRKNFYVFFELSFAHKVQQISTRLAPKWVSRQINVFALMKFDFVKNY